MKRLIGVLLVGVMAISCVTGCSPASNQPAETSATTTKAESRPQDDFYRYVNLERLKDAKFDSTGVAGSAFEPKLIDEQVDAVIKSVAEGSGYEAGSEEDVIKKAYDAYLKYDFKNEPIPKDLAAMVDEIQNAKTVNELLMLDGKLYKNFAVGNTLNAAIDYNRSKPDERILSFKSLGEMCGVSFGSVRESNAALNSIVSDVKTIMQTRGYDKEKGAEIGKKLANLTLKVYGSTDMDYYDDHHDLSRVVICSRDEIDKIMTNVSVKEYIKSFGIDEKHCEKFCVYDKPQLAALNSILTDENLETLKAWRITTVYNKYMRLFAPHYKELSSYVTDSYETPEKQAVNEIKEQFSGMTDPIYVERYYDKKTDEALRSMCEEIRGGYRKLISNAKWLSEPTRQSLLKKLENIVIVTATDLKREDRSTFAGLSGNYYEILIKYQRIIMAEDLSSMEEPVDRHAVAMAMQDLNACYISVFHNIIISAAITNEPFFDAKADHYTNLGGLGSVIAHEMGHAFDSNNIVFDQDGAYNPKWISEEDLKTLKNRNEKAVSYFEDNFTVFGIHHVDGRKTLGENYADLGGMECVTSLAKNKEDFVKIFERYAIVWGSKTADVSLINQLAYDEHSPDMIRVNAILATLSCFYDTYDVKEGDGMYIAPEKRISRWY